MDTLFCQINHDSVEMILLKWNSQEQDLGKISFLFYENTVCLKMWHTTDVSENGCFQLIRVGRCCEAAM